MNDLDCELSIEVIRDLYHSNNKGFARSNPSQYQAIKESTQFLTPKAPLRQRLWHLYHDTDIIPTCGCGRDTKWHVSSAAYNVFCSVKCANNDVSKKEAIKKTTIEVYGQLYVHTEEYRVRQKHTSLKRYGTSHPMQSDEIKAKQLETVQRTYGTSHAMKVPEIAKRSVDNKIAKYGEDCFSVIAQRGKDTYSTLNDGYNTASQTHISHEVFELLNDPKWLTEQHHNLKKSCEEIGSDLGVYNTTIHSYLNKFNIDIKRFSQSFIERKVLSYIIDELKLEAIERDRSMGFELDILIPSHNLAIEVCGLYWHSDAHERMDRWYHHRKWKACNERGIQLLTIFEDEINNKFDIVKSSIAAKLGISTSPRIYARNTTPSTGTALECNEFFNLYHIQGSGPGALDVVLRDKQEHIVAAMRFINKKDVYLLNRYASTGVVGGFSKLISWFNETININNKPIDTFSDRCWSDGSLYDKCGFKRTYELDPDYRYVVNGERKHKFGFRHASLRTKLKQYDPSLTEVQNCHNNNIFRIWNCGMVKHRLEI